MWNYGMHAAGWGWWVWLLMLVGTVAFWVAVAWFVRSLLQDRPGRHNSGSTAASDATRILDERLARGEITPEEHLRLREVLTEGRR